MLIGYAFGERADKRQHAVIGDDGHQLDELVVLVGHVSDGGPFSSPVSAQHPRDHLHDRRAHMNIPMPGRV